MFRCCAKPFFYAILLTGFSTAQAQTSSYSDPLSGHENNPYTKYGIGALANANSASLQGMGNISAAFHKGISLNSDNPASYSFLTRATFEAGATAQIRTTKSQDITFTSGTATLAYMNIGLPVGKHAGISFGFRPYSSVYYNLVDTLTAYTNPKTPAGLMIRNYNGDGGLNYPYLGGAYRYKGVSLGVNIGYLFGNMRHTTAVIPRDTLTVNNAYTAEFSDYTHFGGLYWKSGLMYEVKLDSSLSLTFGGTLALGQAVKEKLNSYWIASYAFSDTTARDTIYQSGQQTGSLNLPLSFSGGVNLSRADKWMIGIDYSATKWSGFSSTPDASLNDGVGSTAYRISAGGEYTPDIASIRNYLSRVTYRAGLYYGTDYVKVNGTTLPVYGFTAGASLPFKRSLSRINVAFDMGRLGTTSNNLMQQTFIRFTAGMSFNDLWFIKKYDE